MSVIGSMTNVNTSYVENILKNADANKDGKVTKAEQKNYYNVNFVPKDPYTSIVLSSEVPFIEQNFDNLAKASGGGDAIWIENIKNIAKADGDVSKLSIEDIEATIAGMPVDDSNNTLNKIKALLDQLIQLLQTLLENTNENVPEEKAPAVLKTLQVDHMYNETYPETMAFQSSEALNSMFPGIEQQLDVDFSKQMVLFLQKEEMSSRPLNVGVDQITAGKDGLTVDWSMHEVAQGIAPPPPQLMKSAAFVVVERDDRNIEFAYNGIKQDTCGYLVPSVPTFNGIDDGAAAPAPSPAVTKNKLMDTGNNSPNISWDVLPKDSEEAMKILDTKMMPMMMTDVWYPPGTEQPDPTIDSDGILMLDELRYFYEQMGLDSKDAWDLAVIMMDKYSSGEKETLELNGNSWGIEKGPKWTMSKEEFNVFWENEFGKDPNEQIQTLPKVEHAPLQAHTGYKAIGPYTLPENTIDPPVNKPVEGSPDDFIAIITDLLNQIQQLLQSLLEENPEPEL